MKSRLLRCFFVTLLAAVIFISFGSFTIASPYGRGKYGSCTYGETCTISAATFGTVSLSIEPTVDGVYTINEDQIEVTTNSNSGYVLTIESDSDTKSTLEGIVDEIDPVSGTPASPVALTGNQWGYRVDGFSSFGAGPTSSVENASSSSATFAGLPFLNNAATIRSTSVSAPLGEVTSVWYGVRADFDVAPDTYTRTVIYTTTVQ